MSKHTHFILDEAGALQRMPALDDAVDKYRAFGIRLQFYYQSLGQPKKCWPDDQGQTLISNTTKVFFGCNDLQTAQFISQSAGNETLVVQSGGANSGWSRNHGSSRGSGYSESSGSSYSGGSSSNWQQQGRELLKPDEIMALDPRVAITLTPGVRPIWTRLIRYYEEKSLFRRRGWLMRLAAACWTLLISAALLLLAAAMAIALSREVRAVTHPQPLTPMAPPLYQPQPLPTPAVPAPPVSTWGLHRHNDSPIRPRTLSGKEKR